MTVKPPDVDLCNTGEEYVTDYFLCVVGVHRSTTFDARRLRQELAVLCLASDPWRRKGPDELVSSLRHLEKLCSADHLGLKNDSH